MAGKMIDYFVCSVQHLGSYVNPFQTGLNIKMYTSPPLYYHSTNSLKELKGIKSTYPKFPTRENYCAASSYVPLYVKLHL